MRMGVFTKIVYILLIIGVLYAFFFWMGVDVPMRETVTSLISGIKQFFADIHNIGMQ